MANLNKVMIIGTLTRDPELRVTGSGHAICQFGLAINRAGKDGNGNVTEEVTFIDVEAWQKQAETIAKFLKKGRQAYIEGRLKLDQWDDKTTGQKRSKLKVVLEHFQFIGGREPGGDSSPPPSSPPPATNPQPASSANEEEPPPF